MTKVVHMKRDNKIRDTAYSHTHTPMPTHISKDIQRITKIQKPKYLSSHSGLKAEEQTSVTRSAKYIDANLLRDSKHVIKSKSKHLN